MRQNRSAWRRNNRERNNRVMPPAVPATPQPTPDTGILPVIEDANFVERILRLLNETPETAELYLATVTANDIWRVIRTGRPDVTGVFWQELSDLIDLRLAGLLAARGDMQRRLYAQRKDRLFKEAMINVRKAPKPPRPG